MIVPPTIDGTKESINLWNRPVNPNIVTRIAPIKLAPIAAPQPSIPPPFASVIPAIAPIGIKEAPCATGIFINKPDWIIVAIPAAIKVDWIKIADWPEVNPTIIATIKGTT